MTNIKSTKTNMPAQDVTLACVTAYIAYLVDGSTYMTNHNETPTAEPQEEPQVSIKAKDTAIAIFDGLGGVDKFNSVSHGVRWLFHGKTGLDADRQHDTSFFFYANKENLLELMNDIVANKSAEKGSLAYFLLGMGVGGLGDEKNIRAVYDKVRKDNMAPFYEGITEQGIMISQMLYYFLFYIELEYQTTYCKSTVV